MTATTETTTPPTSRKASRPVRRQQLIDATIEVLARKGYSALTVADVAKTAGLSVGIINFHFESKEKLLASCLAYLAEEYYRNWKAALAVPGASVAEKLKLRPWRFQRQDIYPRQARRLDRLLGRNPGPAHLCGNMRGLR